MIDSYDAYLAGQRIKNGFRRAVRGVLFSILVSGPLIVLFFEGIGMNPAGSSLSDLAEMAVISGVMAGPILYIIYRILRFAFGH